MFSPDVRVRRAGSHQNAAASGGTLSLTPSWLRSAQGSWGGADVFDRQESCSPRALARANFGVPPKCPSPRLGTDAPVVAAASSAAPQGAPLSHEDAKAPTGSRQADDNVQYEFKSVQALRGRESSAKAKWQDQGWEFVSENRGTLRTELNFRRVKPKTFGAHLLSIVAAFRRSQPKTQLVLVASCALILVAGIIGIVVGTQAGATPPNRARRRPRLRPRHRTSVRPIVRSGRAATRPPAWRRPVQRTRPPRPTRRSGRPRWRELPLRR